MIPLYALKFRHSSLGARFGIGVAFVLVCYSTSQAQETISMPSGIAGPAAAQLRQEAFQIDVRNGQQRQMLEQLKNASPLTYYDNDWRVGRVKLAGGQELEAEMRYNLVARVLEIRRPDSLLLLQQFQAARFGTALPAVYREFVAHPYQSAQSSRDYNLFEKLSAAPGPVQLLLLHEVVMQTVTAAFAPGGTGRPAEQNIERVSRLYVRVPKRPTVQEISLSKPSILRLFGNDAKRMAAYATAHNLSFTDLAHVVQLVDEYNKTAQL